MTGGSSDSDLRFFGNKIGRSAFAWGIPPGGGADDVLGDGMAMTDVAGEMASGTDGGRLGDRCGEMGVGGSTGGGRGNRVIVGPGGRHPGGGPYPVGGLQPAGGGGRIMPGGG